LRMQENRPIESQEVPLDDQSLSAIHSFLEQQQAGLSHLTGVMKNVQLDLSIMSKGLSSNGPS